MFIYTSFKEPKYKRPYIIKVLPPGKEQEEQVEIIKKSLREQVKYNNKIYENNKIKEFLG